jgi:hypothetical protein
MSWPSPFDLLRHAAATNCLRQKPEGSLLIPLLGQEKVNRLAMPIHRATPTATPL